MPGLANYLTDIFLLLFFLLLFLSCGQKILFFFLPKDSSLNSDEEIIISLGIGIGFWMLSIFVLGMTHLLQKNTLIFVIAVFSGLCLREFKNNIFYFRVKLRVFFNRPAALKKYFFYLLISIPLLVSLLGALTPPTFYDSLVYHLAESGNYVRNSYLRPLEYNLFSHFPQNMEMLSTLGLLIWDDLLANLFHWIFLPLSLWLIYLFCRRFTGSNEGKIAGLIFVFTPAAMLLAMGSYVELGLCFFSFLAIYNFFLWQEKRNKIFIFLMAIFAGLALGIKYTAGVIVLILLAGILVDCLYLKKQKLWPSLGLAALFLGGTVLTFSPWAIKNFFWLKNPVFPFLCNIFGYGGFSPEKISGYLHHLKTYNPSAYSWSNLLFLPWRMTMEATRYGGGFDMLGSIWGGLYLLFLPAIFYVKNKTVRWLGFFSLIYFVFWIFSGQVLRFLFPLLTVLSILIAAAGRQVFSKKIIFLCLGVFFVNQLYLVLFVMANWYPWKTVLGSQAREEYLSQILPYYDTIQFANKNLPKQSKILFLGELRAYYSRHNFIASTTFDQTPIVEWANASADLEELRSKIKLAGVTHLLINFPELERLNRDYRILYFTEKGGKIKEEFKMKHLKEIYQKNMVVLYEVLQ
ncbi:MAG: glycosyltransferase family 39 protein [Elusimicrobiota bacterium]